MTTPAITPATDPFFPGSIPPLPCTCTRCGNEWRSKLGRPPKQCPHCKTPYWNIPRAEKHPHHCLRCNHAWSARGPRDHRPSHCPNCSSKLWGRPLERHDEGGLDCSRCGHVWTQKGDEAPKQCPFCHSHYWRQTAKPRNPYAFDHSTHCTVPVWARRRGYAPAAAALVMESHQLNRPKPNGAKKDAPALLPVDLEPTEQENALMIAFITGRKGKNQNRMAINHLQTNMQQGETTRLQEIADANAAAGRTPEWFAAQRADMAAEAAGIDTKHAAALAASISPKPFTPPPATMADAMAALYAAAKAPPPFNPADQQPTVPPPDSTPATNNPKPPPPRPPIPPEPDPIDPAEAFRGSRLANTPPRPDIRHVYNENTIDEAD